MRIVMSSPAMPSPAARDDRDDRDDREPILVAETRGVGAAATATGDAAGAPQAGAAAAEAASAPAEPSPATVGVTLVTGFLGSGKSTLVRRVLTEAHGMRILVVENEFGDRVSSSIEAAVITPATFASGGGGANAQLVEMPNGCICCAASEDLVDALTRLLRRPDGHRFDHIIVEASGLADPGPVAAAFWLDEQLETRLRLNAIVTVVDSNMLPMYLGLPRPWEQQQPNGGIGGSQPRPSEKASLAQKQIAVADAILLNKMDLLRDLPQALDVVRSTVDTLKATPAIVVETVQCNVPLESILNINAYDPSRCTELASSELFTGKPVHPRGVGSVSFSIGHAEFDSSKLDRAYGQLLWEDRNRPEGAEIWRAKALVAIRGEEKKVIYQAVHTLFEGERSHITWNEGENRASSFVFIGRGLVKAHLRDVILTAIAGDE